MKGLEHYAEPRAATGGLAAAGALNLLGRPDIDPLVVLVREAVQNSWDARAPRSRTVTVGVELRDLTGAEAETLRTDVFAERPPKGLVVSGGEEDSRLDLSRSLDGAPRILSFTDTGTTGLGGLVRADRPAEDGSNTDFVDLVFNIGTPPDKEFGGGSYGFGKTISYLVSQCRTVIIHSRTEHQGKLQTRLIAQAFGDQYAHKRSNYTGRHWWGDVKQHGVEPVTGRRADRIAAALGLPEFAGTETGTTIAIIDPDLGGRSPEQAMNVVSSAIMWNFWPKMVPTPGKAPAMSFSVRCNGSSLEVPKPRDFPPLDVFAEALQVVRSLESGKARPSDFETFRIFEVRSERPRAHLGWLALHPSAVRPQMLLDEGLVEDPDDEPIRTIAPFEGPAHHVALMRQPELVVEYLDGPQLPNSALQWTGVFKPTREIDESFRAAEPPTHDAWQPALVPDKRMRRHVNIALTRVKSFVNAAFAAPVREVSPSDPAVVFADQLGHLLAPVGGTGASLPRKDGGTRSTGGRSTRVVTGRRRLVLHDGRPHLELDFEVVHPTTPTDTVVVARAAAASADGMENDPPVGAPVPVVVGFRSGQLTVEGARLELPSDGETAWTLLVEQPPGVSTAVDVRVEKHG